MTPRRLPVLSCLPLLSALACGGTTPPGQSGDAGTPAACTLTSTDATTATLKCGDTSFQVELLGNDDTCTLVDHDDGTATLTCGTTSTEVLLEREAETVDRIVGSLTIANTFDLARYGHLREVTGSISIAELNGLETLELPNLERVGGRFDISGQPTLKHLRLPRLASARALNFGGATALEEFSAPLLASVTEDFVLTQAGRVQQFQAPLLASVGSLFLSEVASPGPVTLAFPALTNGGSFGLSNTDADVTFSFPVLATVTNLSLNSVQRTLAFPQLHTVDGDIQLGGTSSAPLFETLEFPALTSLGAATGGGMTVQQVAGLRQLRLPVVGALPGRLSIRDCADLEEVALGVTSLGIETQVFQNPRLQALRFPRLATVSGYFGITSNAALVTLEMPLLRTVENSFSISSNVSLSQCTVETILNAVTSGSPTGTGNLACE